ncbi:MAG: tetratricopeptide repeat protein, partial [Polyangiaceae bacterium]
SEDDTEMFRDWFSRNKGLKESFRETTEEYEAIAERLGNHHAAHMDLGGAYYREGRLDDAERHLRRATELGYPLPGLALNYLACIAARRGHLERMKDLLAEAIRIDPQHWVLQRNTQTIREWLNRKGPPSDLQLKLEAGHDFQLLERVAQPTLPGPLASDFAAWAQPSSVCGNVGGAQVSTTVPRKLRVLGASE